MPTAGATDMCSGSSQPRPYQVVVEFQCASDGSFSLGAPVFAGKDDTACELRFTWTTSVACPVSQHTGDNCEIVDPVTSKTIDFGQLSGRTWSAKDSQGHQYRLAVCGSLEPACLRGSAKGSAACQVDNHGNEWSLGEPSRVIVLEDDQFVMHYTNGSACSDGRQRSMTIVFTCNNSAAPGVSGPSSCVEASSCVYECTWPTSLACHEGYLTPPTTVSTTTTTRSHTVTTPTMKPTTTTTTPTTSTTSQTRPTSTSTSTTTTSTTTSGSGPKPTSAPTKNSKSSKLAPSTVAGIVIALLVVFAVCGVIGYKWDAVKKLLGRGRSTGPSYEPVFNFANSTDDDDELLS